MSCCICIYGELNWYYKNKNEMMNIRSIEDNGYILGIKYLDF